MKTILTIMADEENNRLDLSSNLSDPGEMCAFLTAALIRVAVEKGIPWRVLLTGIIKAYEPYEEEAE